MNGWIAVGDEANWERGLENGIWGLRKQLENHWLKLQPGDVVLFYSKAPIKGFIGSGIIRSRFKQTTPYWKEEIRDNCVYWPFRFEFDVSLLIPLEKWQSSAISNNEYHLAVLAGISPVKDVQKAIQIIDKLKIVAVQPAADNKHLLDRVAEIGKIQRMFVETGYSVDRYSLDVIWKRTIRSVPTFGFSINMSKDLDHSLQSLKHAFDLWNTRPFLITSRDRKKEVHEYATGTYHEFFPSLKILDAEQIADLYQSKKKYFELEEEYGLR